MVTAVRTTTSMVDEFAKFAHDAIDAFREKGMEFEGSMTKLMSDTNAFGMKFGEGTKLGSYIEKNPSRAAMLSFMTGLMFTRFMKARGVDVSFEAPEVMEKVATDKAKSTRVKKAA